MSGNKAPYIKKASLKGYKSIKDLEIELLSGLNIVIGANGSGKSNFLELMEKTLDFGYNEKDRGLKIEAVLEVIDESESQFIRPHGQYLIDWKKNEDGFLQKKYTLDKSILRNTFNEADFLHHIFPIYYKINFNLPDKLLALDDNLSIKISYDEKYDTFFVNYNLDDKPKFLYLFIQRELISERLHDVFDSPQDIMLFFEERFSISKNIKCIKQNLSSYTPIQDFRFNEGFSVKINKDNEVFINYLRLEFLVNDEWLDWQQLSDGTKRLFYIVAEVTAQEDSIILLEEPELGVHPHQLRKLMNFLKEQSTHKQIILTTHSPQVLNILNSDELDRIVVAEMTPKGTKMCHLTDKQIKKAQKYMATELSLGDYWEFSDLEPQNTAL
jgi:AAA15 family ATPase/GTPase